MMNDDGNDNKSGKMEPRPITRGKSGPALGREIQSKIGQQLRSYYDGLLEPTPDRFANLLRQLDTPKDSDKGSSE